MKDKKRRNMRRLCGWLDSIYPSCLVWLLISVVAVIFAGIDDGLDERVRSIILSIFTGIIASTFVAVFIQKRQDALELEKKTTILFDAGYLLEKFVKSYMKLEKSADWMSEYVICEEAASWLSELYMHHKDVFAVNELELLRTIHWNLYNIKRVLSIDGTEREEFMKCDEKVAEIIGKCDKIVKGLVDSLFGLIISWNDDGITKITLTKG